MWFSAITVKAYLVLGPTDMRKSVNGLSIQVAEGFDLDPFSGQLFVFCNGRRNILKILYYDHNGFCLWYKRLEKVVFRWPKEATDILEIGSRELSWLLQGLEIKQPLFPPAEKYSMLF
ncbi:MAG: IS66 family insertion sequence element accessory protein TnpB [Acidobacteria bacterium]|nr:IS66 family insertion sequence element accessory protein TnpB [Acidobacteriota bacterium]MBU4306412.1 IS66 family insertion sequence element accessory protein TnpB [Acidobacteriota bacterium]MCG2811737.1 IS66 family insertion sequence element accessory protein TnpB [Candidatus Aminicenantes bacterium]